MSARIQEPSLGGTSEVGRARGHSDRSRPEVARNGATAPTLHRQLFEPAVEHACTFRDRIADRPPRPVILAGELQLRSAVNRGYSRLLINFALSAGPP